MRRTRVKICGITRLDDARVAVEAGADAIGLVFYPRSPRVVTAEQAAAIVATLPPFVTAVGLFVDADRKDIDAVLERVPLDLLQFHGGETPESCDSFGHRYIKAVRMRPGIDLREMAERYASADGLLLDAYQKGVPGGTGERFDWDRIPDDLNLPVVLAGGLDPGNITDAVRSVRPFAVDVSSGVEADKGIKDAAKIAAFMRGVRRAEID
ncbi:phosphoribosylanthranilate isomerase [Thiohalomonas denitrificans]|uniref:N-(5'-phosphoribosyl)anthranilate isomerase n=1 Tax=Thiohalomonas denitrificans TaxID=415747 RepID=A0A1G5QPS5_9GAMM|nr:phosphoribosylanthranilate isomerase [Thiohalomonas denitrificans]SCZ63762.1 phosphoribosylanthranilate isomerase [Thiohalomonas denitrificans]